MKHTRKKFALTPLHIQELTPFSELCRKKLYNATSDVNLNIVKFDHKNSLHDLRLINESYLEKTGGDQEKLPEISPNISINSLQNFKLNSLKNIKQRSAKSSAILKHSMTTNVESDSNICKNEYSYDIKFLADSKNTIELHKLFEKKVKIARNKETTSCKSNYKLSEKDFYRYLDRNLSAFKNNVFYGCPNLDKMAVDKYVKNTNIDKLSVNDLKDQSESLVDENSTNFANRSSLSKVKSQFYLPKLTRNFNCQSANLSRKSLAQLKNNKSYEILGSNESHASDEMHERPESHSNLLQAVESYKNLPKPPRHIVIPTTLDAINEKDLVDEINEKNELVSLASSQHNIKLQTKRDLEEYKQRRKELKVSGLKEKHFKKFSSPKDFNLKQVYNIQGKVKGCHQKFMEDYSEHKFFVKQILEKIMNDREWLIDKLERLSNDTYIGKNYQNKMAKINFAAKLQDSTQIIHIIKNYVKIGWRQYQRYPDFTEDLIKAKDLYRLENRVKFEYEVIRTIFKQFLNEEAD